MINIENYHHKNWLLRENLILLLVGGIITYYTVNKYQKNKDQKEIRNTMVKQYTDVLRKLSRFGLYWNDWIEDISMHLTEDKPRDKIIQRNLEESYLDFVSLEIVFFGKILIQYELHVNDLKKINDLQSSISKMGEDLEEIMTNYKKYSEYEPLEYLKLANNLKSLLNIILIEKIR